MAHISKTTQARDLKFFSSSSPKVILGNGRLISKTILCAIWFCHGWSQMVTYHVPPDNLMRNDGVTSLQLVTILLLQGWFSLKENKFIWAHRMDQN